MRIEWVRDVEQFDTLEAEWDALADLHQLPFLRHAWFAAWWVSFAAGRELSVCTVRDGRDLVAAFPLCTSGRRLEPLANDHTPLFGPIARDDASLRALLGAVVEASPSLTVPLLPDDHPAFQLLTQPGRLALVQARHRSPYVDTSRDKEAYWAALSAKSRRDFRRCLRLLSDLPGLDQAILEKPLDLDVELKRGFEVEGSGWKSHSASAVADSADTSTFYYEIGRRFTKLRKVGLSTISTSQRVIAFNFNLIDYNRVWGLKGGYDVDFSNCAPGMLLILAEIERCCELRLAALELLGTEESWKRKFTHDARSQSHVQSFGRDPLSLARYAYSRHLRPRLKRLYRRLVGTPAKPNA